MRLLNSTSIKSKISELVCSFTDSFSFCDFGDTKIWFWIDGGLEYTIKLDNGILEFMISLKNSTPCFQMVYNISKGINRTLNMIKTLVLDD
jgi:hypothetical protein